MLYVVLKFFKVEEMGKRSSVWEVKEFFHVSTKIQSNLKSPHVETVMVTGSLKEFRT